MSQVIVISHANCTDGWGSINALHKLCGADASYYAFGHGDIEKIRAIIPECQGKVVLVVDYALPVAIWQEVCQIAGQVITLDHHASAMKDYAEAGVDIIEGINDVSIKRLSEQKVVTCFDMNTSGAMLARVFCSMFDVEFTYPELKLYSLIQDMDLFIKQYPDSAALYAYIANKAMYTDALHQECVTPISLVDLSRGLCYYSFITQNLDQVLSEGRVREQLFAEQVAKLAEYADTCSLKIKVGNEVCTFDGMIMNANFLFASELGSQLAAKANSFAMIYSIIHGKAKISFRSVKGYDCSIIAKMLGGGGHKQASACVVDIETLFDIIEGKVIQAINN